VLLDWRTIAASFTGGTVLGRTRPLRMGLAPVVGVFDAHVQAVGLQGRLHGGRMQHSGAKKGELRGLVVC
jgi:hypothetical protein